MNAAFNVPSDEHEFKETVVDDIFYPDHVRVATPTFTKTKRDGRAHGDVCAISGQAHGIEYHHVICEDAFTAGVDWVTVKGIALGEIKTLPVLDLVTDLPTDATFPVSKSLIGMLLALTSARGFDWHAFDPAYPESFVDSAANMLVLHEKFHRSSGYGIHHHTLPIWLFQAFPRVPGFIYSPDELAARHLSNSGEST
jgi:hypothetical protein